MNQLSDFVGTWRASQGESALAHTFIWLSSLDGLQGRWTMEVPEPFRTHQAGSGTLPSRIELPVISPWLEAGVVYFKRDEGPLVAEFRLEGPDRASVGAAADKLPAEFATAEYRRSFERHRVLLVRQRDTTT